MARAQKKISKKEIRQDPLVKMTVQAQSWYTTHSRSILIALAAIMLIVIGSVVVRNMRSSANEDAALAVAQAKYMLTENRKDAAMTTIRDAADRFKGTQGAAEALFSLCELDLSDGEYDKSLSNFIEFENQYGREYLLGEAALSGQAVSQEDLDQFDQAAMTYDKLVKKNSFGHLKPFALFQAGRCWKLAGDKEKARVRYESVINDYPDSPVKADAERELIVLKLEG